MAMVPANRTISPERELDFERERILNLIGSKVRRKDMDIARNLAEDLYNLEIEFALRRQVEKLRKHNRLVFRIFIITLPIIVASVTFLVLGLHPSFYLVEIPAALVFMTSFIVANGVFVRRFERNVAHIVDAYEIKKQNFTRRLIERFLNFCSADEVQTSLCLMAIKSDLNRWLAV